MTIFNQNRIFRVFQLISFLKAKPPKTIRNIVKMLDTSERTVYRYMDLLKDIGFRIDKDNGGRFWIASTGETDVLPFTPQERDYLEKLIKSTGKRSKLTDSILLKLFKSDEIHIGANHLFKAYLSQLVESISIAIVERKQILIRNYSSANSQTVIDRLVEPMCFTDDYKSVSAFEPNTMQNKYFNIERMGSVEILDTPMLHERKHAFFKPDIFGFQGKEMNKEVEIRMSLRSYLFLKEEYPMSSPFISKDQASETYVLRAKVQSYLAPGRFVMGFPNDTLVIGSKRFLQHMNEAKKGK